MATVGEDAPVLFVDAGGTRSQAATEVGSNRRADAGDQINRPCVQRAVDLVGWQGVVLPFTRLFARQGFPVVRWLDGLDERVRHGPGPVLDRPTLSLWELWPSGVSASPPPSPLAVVGFVSTSTWRPAFQAAHALRGGGATMILTAQKPSPWRLCDADASGIHVVCHDKDADAVLVRGRVGPVASARRMVATRYWEERLFAHALRHAMVEHRGGTSAV